MPSVHILRQRLSLGCGFLAIFIAFSCGFFIPFQKGEDAELLISVHRTSLLRSLAFFVFWMLTPSIRVYNIYPHAFTPTAEMLSLIHGSAVLIGVCSHVMYWFFQNSIYAYFAAIMDIIVWICWAWLGLFVFSEEVHAPETTHEE